MLELLFANRSIARRAGGRQTAAGENGARPIANSATLAGHTCTWAEPETFQAERAKRDRSSLIWGCALIFLSAVCSQGCDVIPRDSSGALKRAHGGELRVGVVDHPPWVRFEDGRIAGVEPDLIEAWAKELRARVRWRRGAEAELVEALHRREIDVLAAGLDSKTPYKSKLGLTQPYLEVTDLHGSTRKHVLAVTQGESALLFSLDLFLAAQDKTQLQARVQQMRQERARHEAHRSF